MTTPLDMVVLDELDRFHLALNVINRVERLRHRSDTVRTKLHQSHQRPRDLHPHHRRRPARSARLEMDAVWPAMRLHHPRGCWGG